MSAEELAALPMYTVAVNVIVHAPGVDEIDAAARVTRELSALLRREPLVDNAQARAGTGKTMPVLDVMETGMAVGNGYLWLQVTGKAQRENGVEE